MALVFQRAGEGRFKVRTHALERMLAYRQDGRRKLEGGGLLLGRFILDSPDVVLDAVSTPMPGDLRERHRFVRSQAHQRVVDAAWWASGGTRVYLGEWHTHPEPVPSPSDEDLGSWRRHLADPRIYGEALFFIVVGTRVLRAWEGVRSDGSTVKIGEVRL